MNRRSFLGFLAALPVVGGPLAWLFRDPVVNRCHIHFTNRPSGIRSDLHASGKQQVYFGDQPMRFDGWNWKLTTDRNDVTVRMDWKSETEVDVAYVRVWSKRDDRDNGYPGKNGYPPSVFDPVKRSLMGAYPNAESYAKFTDGEVES